MLSITRGMFAAVATLSLVGLTGCVEWEPEGPAHTETRSVDLDKSELVHVELKMGAGELNVQGGSSKLMETEFRYNRPSLKPEIHYDSSGFRGHLVVEQPSHGPHGNHSDYRWDVALTTRNRSTSRSTLALAKAAWMLAALRYAVWMCIWGLAN